MASDNASFRIQIEEVNRVKDENYRLNGVDMDLKRTKQLVIEGEEIERRLKDQIFEMEGQIGRKTVELQHKDSAISQIDVDVREMQA